MISIRIITSKTCSLCKAFLGRLSKLQFNDFVEYDADDPVHKEELDGLRITDLPAVQIVDDQRVLYSFPYSENGYSPRAMKYKRDSFRKEQK